MVAVRYNISDIFQIKVGIIIQQDQQLFESKFARIAFLPSMPKEAYIRIGVCHKECLSLCTRHCDRCERCLSLYNLRMDYLLLSS